MNLQDLTATDVPTLVRRLNELTARVNTVFGREHQADGQHKVPCWVSPTPGASDFGSTGGQTWAVVVATNVASWCYWKHGTGMRVGFEIGATTVAGTPQNHLTMKIPGGFTSKRKLREMIFLADNGARVDGFALVEANSTTIDIYRADLANFTGGSTEVRGQIEFETTA